MPGSPPDEIRFGLLGPVLARQAGIHRHVPAGRRRILLAALLVRANRAVAADELVARVWDRPPATEAAATLRSCVMRLRRSLGPVLGERIRTVPPGYLIEIRGDGELDLLEHAALCARAEAAAQRADWEGAARELRSALELWRGDPLEDLADCPLSRAERPSLAEGRLKAQTRLAEVELELGLPDKAVERVLPLQAENPFRENLSALLMLALYRSGRQADALRVYQSTRRVLGGELGIDPGPELAQLHQRILESDPALLHVAARPQPLPASPAPPVPAQLPADIADFTGRAEETALIDETLSSAAPAGRLRPVVISAVSGAGGVGKTALAVHMAHRLLPHFPDGQLYVDLHGVDANPAEPEEVLATFLRELGVPESDIPGGQEARAARYRSLLAGRRILVLLDNAKDVAQVRPLLPGSGGCGVLITSRRRLASLAGACVVELGMLDAAEARQLFETVAGTARAAAEPEATEQVLGCCAGLPLALRIAAARLVGRSAWSVGRLAERLLDERRRLDELRVDDIAVRASFRAGYDNLPTTPGRGPDPARAFRLLGLSALAEIGLPAAAALFGTSVDEAEEALELLVDACLLTSPAAGRYRLHDLLRLFATERARAEEDPVSRQQAARRLASWYLAGAVAADKILFPHARRPDVPDAELQTGQAPQSYEQAMEWFETERDALPAVTAMAASQQFHDIAAVFPAVIQGYLNLSAHWQLAITCEVIGLASARVLGDRSLEALMLNSLGIATGRSRQFEAATAHLTASVAIRREIGDRIGELSGLTNLGNVLMAQNLFAESKAYALQALALARALGRRNAEAHALNNLGTIAADLGEVEEAIDYQEQSLAISRELGDASDEAAALLNLGEIHERVGRYQEALSYLEAALPLARASGDRPTEATVLTDLGQIALRLGRTGEARASLTQAETLWRSWDQAEADRVRAVLASLRADSPPGTA